MSATVGPKVDQKARVVHGLCGWTDDTLLKCGKFYPRIVKTSEVRVCVCV